MQRLEQERERKALPARDNQRNEAAGEQKWMIEGQERKHGQHEQDLGDRERGRAHERDQGEAPPQRAQQTKGQVQEFARSERPDKTTRHPAFLGDAPDRLSQA